MLTQAQLKELLHYNLGTGVFTWIKVPKRKPYLMGNSAGSKHWTGYHGIRIAKNNYLAHRLAFLYVEGEIPKEVDHVNHIRNDNRWLNLRACTHKDNQKNKILQKNNKSGFPGVYWRDQGNKWFSYITVSGKKIYLGCYAEKRDAINARDKANVKYGFHENHGK